MNKNIEEAVMVSDGDGIKESGWRINKRIDVATVGMLFLQTLAVVVWGVHLEDRVGVLERTSVTTEQFGRVDEKMNSLKDDMVSVRSEMKDDMTSVKAELENVKEEIRRAGVRGKP